MRRKSSAASTTTCAFWFSYTELRRAIFLKARKPTISAARAARASASTSSPLLGSRSVSRSRQPGTGVHSFSETGGSLAASTSRKRRYSALGL